jgi:hypothetical protein
VVTEGTIEYSEFVDNLFSFMAVYSDVTCPLLSRPPPPRTKEARL